MKPMRSDNTKLAEKKIQIETIRGVIETALIIVVVFMFCVSMTIPAKASDAFGSAFDFMMFFCIIYGIIISIIKNKEIDRTALLLTFIYFAVRLVSYIINNLPVTYGGSIMLQMFYLIGINRQLICSKKRVYTAMYTFLVFDVFAVLICYAIFQYRPDLAERLIEPYTQWGGIPETSIFQNPNYAGMMTAAAVIVCIAITVNSRFNKKICALMIPIAVLNLHMLYIRSTCRAAQLGLMLIVFLMIIVTVVKRLDSVRLIVGLSLIGCILLLVPLCGFVYSGDNRNHVSDSSEMELKVDLALTGRYALWKTTILSQKGHWVFGYGNNKKANKARVEYINERGELDTSNIADYFYWLATIQTRQHNGYLAVINEAGLAGLLAMLALLLYRIKCLKGRFRDGNWEKMLLVYIFWINIFEAKFILQQFFTGVLMMILLMPGCEDDKQSSE